MTGYDKFEKRLKELRLFDEWSSRGGLGRVGAETSEGIVILVHESSDDKYSEFAFPPMSVMQEDDAFRLRALEEFHDHDDDDFIRLLCAWVARPSRPCPLFPEDVYFCWDGAEVKNFEDDPDSGAEEWCPHCDECVDLEEDFKVQKCPNCGKWIVPCSICPLENCSKHCPLERQAILLNGE